MASIAMNHRLEDLLLALPSGSNESCSLLDVKLA